MIVAAAVTALGLFCVGAITQLFGYRLGGTIVIPVLAVYTLKNVLMLPIFVLSTIIAYMGLWVVKRRTLLYGRDELLVAMGLGSGVPILILVGLGSILSGTLRSVLFIGSILPGLAAFNYHQLKPEYRVRDILTTTAIFVVLVGVGWFLISPDLAPTLGQVTPPALYTETTDAAVYKGVAIDLDLRPAIVARPLAVGLFLTGLLVSERVRGRYGLRIGLIAVPLLVIYALASVWLVALYVVLLALSYGFLRLAHHAPLRTGVDLAHDGVHADRRGTGRRALSHRPWALGVFRRDSGGNRSVQLAHRARREESALPATPDRALRAPPPDRESDRARPSEGDPTGTRSRRGGTVCARGAALSRGRRVRDRLPAVARRRVRVVDPLGGRYRMIEQGAFEVARDADGWFWWLCDAELCLAVGPTRFDTAEAARRHVDRVRDAAAAVESLDTDEFEYRDEPSDDENPQIRLRGDESTDVFDWVLRQGDERLAVPNFTYTSRANAREAMDRFCRLATGAVPTFLVGAEADVEYDPFDVGMSSIRNAPSLLARGLRHRRFLDRIDTRIVVSGIRGKSSTTKRLDDVFRRRGYDTLTKITGNHPVLIHNGDVIPVGRNGPYTTLYENINVVREFVPQLESYTPENVAIFENQGITEYTTRLINERFVKPHVVVVANVRQDHQDTLGKTVRDLARAFARTIPAGTKVVNGEQNPVLVEYMREEIEQQGAEMRQVTIPDDQQGRVGAETVYAVNDVLRWLDMEPVPEEQLNSYLDAIQPRWIRLPQGRIFNGAEINDIESTEMIRQILAGDDHVLPFVYLRSDRRSRTASFATYLNTLAERDLIERARAGGAFTSVFASNVDVPVVEHDRDEDAGEVLDDMFEEGYPVLTMGNTVDAFMRDLEETIEQRAKRVAVDMAD